MEASSSGLENNFLAVQIAMLTVKKKRSLHLNLTFM